MFLFLFGMGVPLTFCNIFDWSAGNIWGMRGPNKTRIAAQQVPRSVRE